MRILRTRLGFKQKEMAKTLEISHGYLSAIESGKKFFSGEKLMLLGVKFRLNLWWLLTGEGEMFVDQRPEALGVAEERAPYGDLTPEEREIIDILRENPELTGLCRKLLGGRKAVREALADLQKIPDPSEP